jgi:outer membrane protein assembly factor BamB
VNTGVFGDDQLPFVYQVGQRANLYVLSRDDLTCKHVFYLGHTAGAIETTPMVLAGHLLIPENGPDYCRIYVARPVERSAELMRVPSTIQMKGQVSNDFQRYGRWSLLLSDGGDMQMFEVNVAEELAPVVSVAQYDTASNMNWRHYMFAEDGVLWTVGAGLRRYRVQKALGKFDREVTTENLDVFLGPVIKHQNTLFHLRRRHGSTLLSASAVDPQTHQEIWRTDFGAPHAGFAVAADNRIHVVTAQGDLVALDATATDVAVADDVRVRGSTVVQSLVFDAVHSLSGGKYLVTGPADRNAVIWLDFDGQIANKLSNFTREIDQLSCPPSTADDWVLAATRRGYVFRIDPRTGAPRGTAFLPAITPGQEHNWYQPLPLESGSEVLVCDDAGKIYIVAPAADDSLAEKFSLDLQQPVAAPPVRVGHRVFIVVRTGTGDQLVPLDVSGGLAAGTPMPLDAGRISGPWGTGDLVLVVLDSGNLAAFDGAGQKVWSIPFSPERLAFTPIQKDGEIIIATESGVLTGLDARTGEVTKQIELGQPLSGAPFVRDASLWLNGADGAVHVVDWGGAG